MCPEPSLRPLCFCPFGTDFAIHDKWECLGLGVSCVFENTGHFSGPQAITAAWRGNPVIGSARHYGG